MHPARCRVVQLLRSRRSSCLWLARLECSSCARNWGLSRQPFRPRYLKHQPHRLCLRLRLRPRRQWQHRAHRQRLPQMVWKRRWRSNNRHRRRRPRLHFGDASLRRLHRLRVRRRRVHPPQRQQVRPRRHGQSPRRLDKPPRRPRLSRQTSSSEFERDARTTSSRLECFVEMWICAEMGKGVCAREVRDQMSSAHWRCSLPQPIIVSVMHSSQVVDEVCIEHVSAHAVLHAPKHLQSEYAS
jgi:hypothetical protein